MKPDSKENVSKSATPMLGTPPIATPVALVIAELTPEQKRLLAKVELDANCFVASVGTFFNSITGADVSKLEQKLRLELENDKSIQPVKPRVMEIVTSVVSQAHAVLATDSISQRISRSGELAGELLPLSARFVVTLAATHGNGAEAMPPLPWNSSMDKSPGRCK
jgi:hypothetical protein